METITATTFKIANPGSNSHINNLNLDYDYEQQSKPLSKGNVLHRRYQDDPQSQSAHEVNQDINNRFNYLEDIQYQRSNRNANSNTQSIYNYNNNISNHNGMTMESNFTNNAIRNNPSPIPSNKSKRSLSRGGQFFD